MVDLLRRVWERADTAAFRELYQAYGPRVKAFLMRRADARMAEDLARELLGGAGGGGRPDEARVETERQARVHAALSSVPAKQREVVTRAYLEGLSVTGRYRIGDVADLEETMEQRPVADPGPHCICLVASETPARFRALIGLSCGRCMADG